MGQDPYFPKETFRLLRYSIFRWDKFSIFQEEFFVHEATNYRLLRYSIFGWNKFPISQEESFIHEVTIRRLLRYSAFGGTSSLSPKRIFSSMRRELINYFSTQPSEGQVPYPLRGFFSSIRRQLIDYSGTQPSEGQVPCP